MGHAAEIGAVMLSALPLPLAALPLLLAACDPAPAPAATPPCACDVDTAAADTGTTWDPSGGSGETVLLVSLDGFRRDYLERVETPVLDALAAEGVLADGLVPAFPSKTFPNHTSISTGLYPVHHGIVGNRFYDPAIGWFEMLDPGDNTDPRYWLGEPIWITAEKDGVPAATMFWTGSEVDYDGWHQSIRVPYDGGISYGNRIERVLGWLEQPEATRPRMITLYFDEPDGAGHAVGASGLAVDRAVADMDTTVGWLVQGLEQRGLLDRVHLLIVSDHGMADTSPERLVFLDDHVDLDGVYADNWGPWVPLRPPAGGEAAFAAQLVDIPHATCALSGDLPERMHYTGSERIAPVHCIAEVGWSLTTRAWHEENPLWHVGGTHGYDPADAEMHGILIARGPLLARGVTVPPLDNVHLYGLMAHILGVPPAPNDGDPAVWGTLLAD